jgi:hypothetical protein
MPIEGMATKFDLKDGQFGPYALGTVKDLTGESVKVLFASKDNADDPNDNKPLPDTGCVNRPALWVGVFDANKKQYKVLFSYYTGTSTSQTPENAPKEGNEQGPEYWDAKNLRDQRGARVRDATTFICTMAEVSNSANGLNPELIPEIAEKLVQYVYNGPQPQREPGQDDGPSF